MEREEIFELIDREREYQIKQWGQAFDDKNTVNDWVAYIACYLGKAVTFPFNKDNFRKAILKVATLAVAILEREQYASTHYEEATKRPGA